MNKKRSEIVLSEKAIGDQILNLWFQSHCLVRPDEEKVNLLTKLVVLLCQWNKALNLTAIREPEEMVVLHIIDSMSIEPHIEGQHIADVGTGPGFPGLVLAILHPEKDFTLIDSVAKKISFVKNAAVSLKLGNVTPMNCRCEEIHPVQLFDCVVSRAFAPLDKIVSWCKNLLAPNGKFVAMKANLSADELGAIPKDAVIDKIEELKVPGLDAKRQAVVMSLRGKEQE